jgi:nitrate/TMAO reductase-like tetraheme cytochrome c subunit
MIKIQPCKLTHLFFIATLFTFSSMSLYAADKQYNKLTDVPSETCAECHEEIYDQWKTSMHANSTALKDPIHGTFYKAVVGSPTLEDVRTKAGKYPVCLQCHSPAAAKANKTKLDSKTSFSEGVNCVACHSLTHFKGTKKPDGSLRLGIKAYDYSDTVLQGPRGFEKKKHANFSNKAAGEPDVANNPGLFRTSAVCMGCHDQRPNANKVPLCATGDEVMSAGGSTTCQSCHMSVVDGLPDHSMVGGHSPEKVSKGIAMTLDTRKIGDNINTTVHINNLLPHNFPTGAPFRNFYIKVKAYDKDGKVLWQSSKSHPVKDDKAAMMMLKLGDKGHPAPPPKATAIMGDSRLKPNEKRQLHYRIPADGVVKIVATGYYDLLLPPIKKKFGKSIPKELLRPQEVALAIKTVF